MPYIPHTDEDVTTMLAALGVTSLADLFDEIPSHILAKPLQDIPAGLTEMEVQRIMADRAALDDGKLCFIGAGAYEHHIPAAVWELASRGEFLTAYTPYQAEASQGTLQVIYEFQTMMAELTAMDVANASLYDGGSGLAEAVLMAVRANRKRKSKKVLVLGATNPMYLNATRAIVANQGIELIVVPMDAASGTTPAATLAPYLNEDYVALVIQQPNFMGCLEAVDELTDQAQNAGLLVIGCVNPTAMALLKPPGEWGQQGADIAVGEAQPLGIPLSSGGPYCGFISCKKPHVRQMPGRIIGRTTDLEGRTGFTLTLQAREQHIRRSKATSNICTNQGLAMTAATIYLSLLGPEGLRQVAVASHRNTRELVTGLCALPGVETLFTGPYFHEALIRIPNAKQLLADLAQQDIQAGLLVTPWFSEFSDGILVCATETKTQGDIQRFIQAVANWLEQQNSTPGGAS